MSDAYQTPHDAAILVLRERERELDSEIQGHTRALELAAARREELLDLIAMLSRKPRARKVRAVAEAQPEPANDRSVFGAPSGAIIEAA
jgi:hypothetical protein